LESYRSLSTDAETTYRELPDNLYKHEPLNLDTDEQRFLILHPCSGNKNAEENPVRCSLETVSLAETGGYVAVRNSRGFRFIQEVIDIDGAPLIVPVAVERFLRNFRREDEPVRLWLRHICLIESGCDENRKYWNRPFLEHMYKGATEVLDMAAFNTNLLETKTIMPVYDSRYMKWQKEWSNPHTSSPLPRVFPIRVGKSPSMTNPTDRYSYVPLDLVTDEIRLIVLHGSDDPQAIVNLHLSHTPIVSAVKYQAVSYTWGPREPKTDIIVMGQWLAITKSLDQLLRNLRRKHDLVLWIDAICIDQENEYERNRHVPRMARVYDAAVSVVAALGELDERSTSALDFIPKLQSPALRFDATGAWDVGKPGEFSHEELARLCAATYRILTRPYFRRVWILQEIAWASSPFALCGTSEGPSFWTMDNAARNVQDLMERDPGLARLMNESLADSGGISPTELDAVRKMFYFRHLMSKGRGTDLLGSSIGWNLFQDKSPGYLEVAILARDCEASDPRDKLFALWNLAQDKDGLDWAMDYTDRVPDSFTKFATAWSLQHRSLDIIATSERNPESMNFYDSAPSWCPDWATPSTSSNMVRRETLPRRVMLGIDELGGKLYSADGNPELIMIPEPFFSFEGNKLFCTGIIVDSLKAVVIHEPEHPKLLVYFQAAEKYYKERKDSPYVDYRQALWAMCHGDVPSSWPLRAEKDYELLNMYHTYKGDRDSARHFYKYVTDIGPTEAKPVMKQVLRGRLLGFTEDGYMCLLPHWILPSDESAANASMEKWQLAILAGCSSPVILHESDDGTYRIAGSVFVQGWMEGEVVTEMMGADDVTSFWTFLASSQQLVIM
jgi:hypothetical protein